MGWKGNNNTAITITDCLYAPAALETGETYITSQCGTFVRNWSSTPTNSFYTRTMGDAQGMQARTITAGDYVNSLSISDSATETYDVSGITVYPGGIDFNGTFYGGSGLSVSLALTPEARDGYQFKQYVALQGTLTDQTTHTPTLTMPAANSTANDAVTITVEYDPLYTAAFASGNDNSGWEIYPTQQIVDGPVTVSYTGPHMVKSVKVKALYSNVASFNTSTLTNPAIQLTDDITSQTITRADGTINFNGHDAGTLLIQNNVAGKAVTLCNGSIGSIDGMDGWDYWYSGTVILRDMSISGSIYTDGHPYIIYSGTYNKLYNYTDGTAPGTITIYGGSFSEFATSEYATSHTSATKGTYTLYGGKYKFDPSTVTGVTIPSGYSVKSNTGDDAATYSHIVSKD